MCVVGVSLHTAVLVAVDGVVCVLWIEQCPAHDAISQAIDNRLWQDVIIVRARMRLFIITPFTRS